MLNERLRKKFDRFIQSEVEFDDLPILIERIESEIRNVRNGQMYNKEVKPKWQN